MEEPRLESHLSIEFQERVEDYMAGRLDREEVDKLWEECIIDGEKMDYMTMYANLHMLHKQGKDV